MTKRPELKKKLCSLPVQMLADIKTYCRDKGLESESELIRHAITRYIYADYRDETLKLQGLGDMRKKMDELGDMLDITFRYLRLMHINLLAYNAEIDQDLADAALKSASARHDTFFRAFQESLKNDPPFFERLLHTYFSGEPDGQD
ncbi:MAG: ribbon-helix-helix domain-containing protein [Spirochaetaceae bacterium]|jgi:metal-responsive CopG/Arc/MetJ family transcriptional regulator|nr:ribbon-helix-helix domain-containing protein [Spirochaetaceae bacterium]